MNEFSPNTNKSESASSEWDILSNLSNEAPANVEKQETAETGNSEQIRANRERFTQMNQMIEATHDLTALEDRSAIIAVQNAKEKLVKKLEEDLYRSQAPLVIKDEAKRQAWLEKINECAAAESGERIGGFGFTDIEACDEECLEALASGADVSAVCEILRNHNDEAGPSFQMLQEVIQYADRGQEFADKIGFSGIDFENDPVEVKNEKMKKVAETIGFKNPEDFRFSH